MTATFTCRTNSHPFQERRVSLTEPAKIGRSVARARPAANNAIFDCKVLSRNHALLWYEDGKFYLKDTKSSNGTFVNNQRLSKGAEESMPFEVNSGDIVQFGVDVVENSRRVTHGCIVSQVRLYLPNGDEAKQSDVSLTSHLLDKVPHNLVYPTIQSQDLYQLHQYLQEALHREQMLEQKLALLQRLVSDSHETSEKGWQALIDEDKLLSRLEFLENQLQTYAKTLSEESTQKELLQLQEEKHNYETTSKETLRQVLGEKLEAQQKLGNLERSYSNTEDECTHLRDVCAKTEKALKELSEKHQIHVRESQKISEKAQDAERTHKEVQKSLEDENEDHLKNIQRLEESANDLKQRLEDSLEEIEKYQTEMNDMRDQLNKLKSISKSQEINEDTPKENIDNIKDKLNDLLSNQGDIDLTDIKVSLKEDEIEVVKTIELCEKPVEEKMNIVNVPLAEYNNNLQSSTNQNQNEENSDQIMEITKLEARISQLEDLVKTSQTLHKEEESKRKEVEVRLSQLQEERENEKEMLTETTRELQAALSERESLLEKEEKLRSRIEESENLLRTCDTDSISSSSETEEINQGDADDDISCGSLVIARAKLKELKKKLKEKDALLAAAQSNLEMSDETESKNQQKSKEIEELKSLLHESQESVKKMEAELNSLRNSSKESAELRNKLEEARQLAREQCRLYEEAQQQIQLASESDSSDMKELEEQLQLEKQEKDKRIKEVEALLSSANKHQENYEALTKEKSDLEATLKECKNQINTLQQIQLDSADLAKENKKLSEDKQNLLDDMKLLNDKLEKQVSDSQESDAKREQASPT
uniref:sarcolemmal membrane-associated protein-like isoform X2 n=1 Tax=Styela clava TaxID=7725 RepID=UPI0019394567|nr:sarcolemmal membrane-associated protein-like isoform X2 [Styela clava]